MVGWYHRSNGHEFEQTLGDGEGQGSLVCCSPWVTKSQTQLKRLGRHASTPALFYLCDPQRKPVFKVLSPSSDFTFLFHLCFGFISAKTVTYFQFLSLPHPSVDILTSEVVFLVTVLTSLGFWFLLPYPFPAMLPRVALSKHSSSSSTRDSPTLCGSPIRLASDPSTGNSIHSFSILGWFWKCLLNTFCNEWTIGWAMIFVITGLVSF